MQYYFKLLYVLCTQILHTCIIICAYLKKYVGVCVTNML